MGYPSSVVSASLICDIHQRLTMYKPQASIEDPPYIYIQNTKDNVLSRRGMTYVPLDLPDLELGFRG